ncbi:penicillin-binding protein 1C [Andreprevotia lacus DSM 23236]|jgi:penicillin-binding protein 1C|uniref:peptidoglycan glycosyltransferase n=1 Tax=Andreprevotia lacus DSM 23236 TaxID=1121001 RepID=A0A1W1XN25_9NEIS|nr:penicillin-binding protein 1C [Andreprevotia lacus]SMC25390.1 penicillin-binding protein 1C [Andreprevotia lacus DSM 23236]
MTGRWGRLAAVARRLQPRSRATRRVLGALLLLIVLVLVLDRLFPLPERGHGKDFAAVVLARDGTPLRAFPDAQHVWRYPVRYDQVSPQYVEALIRYEDRGFWWHPGINPLALLRAVGQWIRYGHVVSGGSTLTMQVARIVDPVPHSFGGKLRQMLRALQLELHYSKRQILEIYLNYAPMGGVLEGVEAASRAYLGKPSLRLTPAEAALMTVLPQMPSRLRPDRFRAEAQAARNKVVERMRGRWPEQTINEALTEPLVVLRGRELRLAPLLAQRVHDQRPGQAIVNTTLDTDAQRLVELLLLDRANLLPPHVSAAALVMDNRDLSVLAYAGSADFGDPTRFPWVDMVRAQRSPGSTLKPFLYGMALDDGLIHSESLLIDAPQSFHGYAPGNFGQAFSGPVSASEALVRSLNVPAVQVLDHLGPERFVARLHNGGLKMVFPRGASANLSVILGGAGTTLEELVGAYSALARNGMAGQPRLTPDAPKVERRLLSPGAAFIIRDILEGGGLTAKAVGVRADRRGVAYKTGTSYGFRDAWTVGVNDRYTVGIWIGNPDGTPNPGFYGANIAAPLLQNIFDGLPMPAASRSRVQPASVSQGTICWPEGRLAGGDDPMVCQLRRSAWLLNQTAPPTLPGEHDAPDQRRQWLADNRSGLRVNSDCTRLPYHEVNAARWPVLLEPWLDQSTRERYQPPAWAPGCHGDPGTGEPLHILGAISGEIIAATPGSPVPTLRLATRGGNGPVNWLVNGVLIAISRGNDTQLIKLEQTGRHDITAIDAEGHFDRVQVTRR